jgi:ABC-type lipoprotein export system ATPase subunit
MKKIKKKHKNKIIIFVTENKFLTKFADRAFNFRKKSEIIISIND